MPGSGARDGDLVHDRDLRGRREGVQEWQRERLPPRRDRAAHGDEPRDARAQDALVDREVHGDRSTLGTQPEKLRREGDVGLRPEILSPSSRSRPGIVRE